MKNLIRLFILMCLLFMNNSLAQETSNDTPSKQKSKNNDSTVQSINTAELQREAIKKAEFLTGNWKGTEYLFTPDGVKHNVEASGLAEAKLNGTIILFQGTVKARLSDQGEAVTVYEGIGILTYNVSSQKYRLQHYGTDGSYADYECSLAGKTLTCEQTANGTTTHITISVDNSGRWIEKGERSENGKEWLQFFETKTEKITSGDGKIN